MKALTFNLGKDFDVITSASTPAKPRKWPREKADIMKRYGRPNSDQGWHSLPARPIRSMR